jgi:hypothetical protein
MINHLNDLSQNLVAGLLKFVESSALDDDADTPHADTPTRFPSSLSKIDES